MANKREQRLASPSRGDTGATGGESGFLGHFLESECSADQDNYLVTFVARGAHRRMASLSAIFARCRWEGACLVWQGPDSGTGRGGGYGRVSYDGATFAVHRLVYQLVYGPIAPRKQVDHECNNRMCCNPDHLRHVTHKKNQKLRGERRK